MINVLRDAQQVDLYIPGYIKSSVHKYQKILPKRVQHTTHKWNCTKYGVKLQMVPDNYQYQPLTPDSIKLAQKVMGTLLYDEHALNITLLVELSTIGE